MKCMTVKILVNYYDEDKSGDWEFQENYRQIVQDQVNDKIEMNRLLDEEEESKTIKE